MSAPIAVNIESNYFTLMGLPQRFEVDLKVLKKNSRELQRKYHPDRFCNATPQEQRLAAQFSAQINTAVSVLGNPVQRAMHLLALQGLVLDAQNYTEKDSAFLFEQMELRESLEESRDERDAKTLKALLSDVANSFRVAQQDFSATEIGQGQTPDLPLLDSQALAALVSKMRFFEKLNEEVSVALRAL